MSELGIKARLSASTLWGLALTSIVGVAFFLRTYFPYDNVFTGDWVRFKWFDSWYHVRLVENLVRHFPQRIDFDPYTLAPSGQEVFFAPFYDLLLGFFVWVFGAGHPSSGTIETVAAYFPSVLGALVAIPVFFIGKAMFNKTVGLIAAALVIILPGQFLLRSLLGFTDHHVAETLFSSVTMLFLILAIRSSREKGISFSSLRTRDWGTLKKPLTYSLLAGIALGFYLLSWVGGALLVFIIFIFAFVQYMLDHVRGRSTDYLCIVGVPSLFIALLLVIPFLGQFGFGDLHVYSLLIGILAFIALSALSRLLTSLNVRPVYYLLALSLLTAIGFAALYLVAPSVIERILQQFGWLNPGRLSNTIGEMQPLNLSMIWEEFTTSFYIALVGLAALAYFVIREGSGEKTLLLVWSMMMLMATIGQNRFAYYFAVNAALLTAYLSWQTAVLVGSRIRLGESSQEAIDGSRKLYSGKEKSRSSRKAKRKRVKTRGAGWGTLVTRFPLARHASLIVVSVALFFLVFYPNISKAIDTANDPSKPTQVWRDSLVWMRDNTPDPFEDFDNPDFYYDLYEKPPDGEYYPYPESAYGVMAWWSYGHWITYIAHRIPNTNPHQSRAFEAASFFVSGNESSANRILDRLRSKYVIVDIATASHAFHPDTGPYGEFHAVITWAGEDEDEFYDVFYRRAETGEFQPFVLYYPKYYRSMSSRLYWFDGEEVVPGNSTWVISFTERMDQRGTRYKEITEIANGEKPFGTYEEALEFVDSQTDPNYRIVGNDQLRSPVPLEKLEHYNLVYSSPPPIAGPGETAVPDVKIFEYVP